MTLLAPIALIPARAGSQRIPNKNMRLLAGHPLIAYTIAAAKQSGLFDDRIVVCSDSPGILDCAKTYQVSAYLRQPSPGDEPDIAWMHEWLRSMVDQSGELIMLLRPTSPFRSHVIIRTAHELFLSAQPADSLRLVRQVKEHPAKMWLKQHEGHYILPLWPYRSTSSGLDGFLVIPWHSMPSQTIPMQPYVQTGGLEILWANTLRRTRSITGERILGLEVTGLAGFDVNTMDDWDEAERLVASGAKLPFVP